MPRQVPKLGVVNFGVKDLLIGHPFGLQGEAFVELGQDPATATAAGSVRLFTDEPTPAALNLLPDPNDTRLSRVTLPSSAPVRVRAQLDAHHLTHRTLDTSGGVSTAAVMLFHDSVFTPSSGICFNSSLTRVDEVRGETRAVTFGTRSFLFLPPRPVLPHRRSISKWTAIRRRFKKSCLFQAVWLR